MKHKEMVRCVVCGRKFFLEPDGKPKKHYVAPKFVPLGEVQYLTNPGWEAHKEVCPGSFELGDPT